MGYTPERQQHHRELIERCDALENQILNWDTMDEDDDRLKYEELQILTLFCDMLNPVHHLLTSDGTASIEQKIATMEHTLQERLAP